MLRAAILAGGLAVAAGLSPAGAQSWSVGVGFGYGAPDYYDEPPVYLYEQPPVLYAPPPVARSVSPDAVFDALERSGYREFSPMAFREGVYKLNAVNRRGDLVALEVSALSGRVEREYVLQAARHPIQRAAPSAQRRSKPPTASQAPTQPSEDPLVVY